MYFYGINVLSIGKFIKFSSFQRYAFVRHFFFRKTSKCCFIRFIRIPEHHDDSVENVESVAYVTERTLRDDLQQHFHSKDGRKYDIAYLNHYGQLLRLSTDKQ